MRLHMEEAEVRAPETVRGLLARDGADGADAADDADGDDDAAGAARAGGVSLRWYDRAHRELAARDGARVLALAYRPLPRGGAAARRADVERGLRFAGFAVFRSARASNPSETRGGTSPGAAHK